MYLAWTCQSYPPGYGAGERRVDLCDQIADVQRRSKTRSRRRLA
jgi:hypothetical protein